MAINNFTFFSPDGDNFPVSANADGKLYQMLTGMDIGNFRLRHWSPPLNTALNRIYVRSSLLVSGRYFELNAESIVLAPNTSNYIHAVIDLANPRTPVKLTVENRNNSTRIDINNVSGIQKVCFELVITDPTNVISSTTMQQITEVDVIKSKASFTESVRYSVDFGQGMNGTFLVKGDLVNVRFGGTLTTIANGGTFPNKIPEALRPKEIADGLVGHFASQTTSFHIDISTDGSVKWWGAATTGNNYPRGSAMYFLS